MLDLVLAAIKLAALNALLELLGHLHRALLCLAFRASMDHEHAELCAEFAATSD